MRKLTCGLLLLSWMVLVTNASADDDFRLEPGFALLFNGKDLTGWKTLKGDSLDGKTEAYKKRFTVADGKLIIDPKVPGDVRIVTAKELAGDVHIKFEYFPGKTCNNDLFFRGQKFDLVKGIVKNIEFDKWNQFEIIVTGDKIEFKNNGQTQRSATTEVKTSNLGIRAELGPAEFRRIRLKSAP